MLVEPTLSTARLHSISFLSKKRTPKSKQLSSSMSNLPLELIIEILCRLPVKELLCFRCVSKPWCALIDSRNFIELHLKHSVETTSNLDVILRNSNLYSMSFDSEDPKELHHPLMCYNHGIRVLGSCNGLLCICNVVDDMALWNPSIKQYCMVPFLPVELKRYFGTCSCSVQAFGFGYDVINDDYKVVRIAQFEGVDRRSFESEVKVYSLRKNRWRRIGDMPYFVHYPGANGLYACGALHWVVSQNPESNVVNIIVSLDLGIEDYKEVPQPEYTDKNYDMDVGVLRGCLCLLANFQGEHVDVWVMKEYGVKESWTKLFSVTQQEVIRIFRSLKPLAFSRSGNEVLIECDNVSLCWFDLKSKQVKNWIYNIPYTFEAEICVGSLVPLNARRRYNDVRHHDHADADNGKMRDDFLSEGFKLVL